MSFTHIMSFGVLALFWGGSFLAIHHVVAYLPPALGAFLRVGVCFCAATIFLLWRRPKTAPAHLRWQAAGAGIFNLGISWILLFSAQKLVNPALASIYNSTTTIFVALLAPFMIAMSRMTLRRALGVAVGFAGVLTILAPKISAGAINDIGAQAALAGMAICYAIGTLWIKKISARIDIGQILFYQSISGMTILLGYSLLREAPWTIALHQVPLTAFMAVLYLGLCSTFIAWLIYIRLINERGAVQAAAVVYLIPPLSMLLDWLVLHRVVHLTDAIGAGIILAGVWLIQHHKPTPVPTPIPQTETTLAI